MIEGTCLNCTDRVVGCHSTCQKYIEAVRKMNEEHETIRENKHKSYLWCATQKAKRHSERRPSGKRCGLK